MGKTFFLLQTIINTFKIPIHFKVRYFFKFELNLEKLLKINGFMDDFSPKIDR